LMGIEAHEVKSSITTESTSVQSHAA